MSYVKASPLIRVYTSTSIRAAGPSKLLVARFSTSRIVNNEISSDIQAKLREGLKAAMKGKDKASANCIKAILADITYNVKASADPNATPTQEAIITAIRKGIDKRNQAALSYSPESPSPHPENYSNLQSEISLLKSYLPTGPSSDSVQQTISDIISSLSSEVRASKSVTGSVMKSLWEKLGDGGKASVDKKEVAKWVTEALKKIQI